MPLGRSGGRLLDHRVTRRGTFGTDRHGPPIALGVMGDSLAVGYGARSPASAPAALIAAGLVEASDRPVSLTNVAEVGAESAALLTQLTKLRERTAPDVVLVYRRQRRHAYEAVDRRAVAARGDRRSLRAGGAEVVVATCPDFGTVREFAQPLRVVATGTAGCSPPVRLWWCCEPADAWYPSPTPWVRSSASTGACSAR